MDNKNKVPAKQIPFRLLGEKGSNPIPIIDKLWEFYVSKGTKTVFVSLGTSSSPLAELEIGEILGCPIHVVDPSKENHKRWNQVSEILKSRKRNDESEFTKEVENKWVLPKNLRVSESLPFFFNGTLDLSGSLQIVAWESYIKSVCEKMGNQENSHLDLLNVQLSDSSIIEPLLYSLTNSMYRPGLIMVTYPNRPDSNLLTTQAAGHLQNVGYQLLNKENNHFLYVYIDKNVYEYASYENKNVENPLISEVVRATGNFVEK
jgi:hypothetical protein